MLAAQYALFGISSIINIMISIALCILGGTILKNKGHSFWLGFLVVFFLGLLGLIVLLFWPASGYKKEPRNPRVSRNNSNHFDDDSPIKY